MNVMNDRYMVRAMCEVQLKGRKDAFVFSDDVGCE